MKKRARQRIKELEKNEAKYHLHMNNMRYKLFDTESELRNLRRKIVSLTVELDYDERYLQLGIVRDQRKEIAMRLAELILNSSVVSIAERDKYGRLGQVKTRSFTLLAVRNRQ